MSAVVFDPSRAKLAGKNLFEPFYVKQTSSLQEAVDAGKVKADADVLLLDHPQQPLTLLKGEMAYHHVAQGKIAGEPWLVSF